MALCCLLAFWTGGDGARADRLFRQSGLLREKWDDVHYRDGSTYGEKTVERAIANTDEVYDPSNEDQAGTGRTAQRAAQDETISPAQTVGGTDGARAAYLAEKNKLLSHRVSDLEAMLEQKNERIEELEQDNRSLWDALTSCEDHLERRDQATELPCAGDRDSLWSRAKRLLGDERE